MFNLDFTDWIRGLIAAIVSGGSSAVVSGVTVTTMDPEHFKGGYEMLSLMGILFVVNGAMGMFLYLKQKPVPDIKTVTTTTATTTQQQYPPAVVKTVVQEVHTEPVEKP